MNRITWITYCKHGAYYCNTCAPLSFSAHTLELIRDSYPHVYGTLVEELHRISGGTHFDPLIAFGLDEDLGDGEQTPHSIVLCSLAGIAEHYTELDSDTMPTREQLGAHESEIVSTMCAYQECLLGETICPSLEM